MRLLIQIVLEPNKEYAVFARADALFAQFM